MLKIFQIVCEGKTDFVVYKKLIEKIAELHGFKTKVLALYPPKGSNDGGWPNLKGWCQHQASAKIGNQQRHAAAASALGSTSSNRGKSPSRDKIGAALSIHGSKIIIQMDSDIAEEAEVINDSGMLGCLPLHPKDRIGIVRGAICNWLGPYNASVDESIFLSINSLALENWILATHAMGELSVYSPMSGCDFDSIHSPDQALIRLGYPRDSGRLRKTEGSYKNHAVRLVSNLSLARAQSATLEKFSQLIASI